MLSYCLTVGYSPTVQTCSLPASPPPPPVDHQAEYRRLCLLLHFQSIISGCSHDDAVKAVARRLREIGHPWSAFHVVQAEINIGLGRRRGRPSAVPHV